MKSKQINFYFMPEDISEISKYIQEKNLVIYNNYSANANLQKLDSLMQTKIIGKASAIKYITSESLSKEIKNEFLEKQNYYSIDVISSPVIEFLIPKNIIQNNIIHSGRVYYIHDIYNSQNLLVSKSDLFLQIANELFKWIKKNFKNTKLPGFEAFLVSERTHEWIKVNGGKLADMVREEEYRKKKLIAV
jgi:hypothetical protein